ncbi:MAG: hypothetical protein ACC655_03180 [Rhodothermia bacterium]
MTQKHPRKTVAILIAVFFLHALPWLKRPSIIGGDEPHYALMAHSIAADHDLDLVEDYRQVAKGSKAAGRRLAGKKLDSHFRTNGADHVFSHPLGLPLIAAPLIAVQQRLLPGSAPDVPLGLLGLAFTFAALFAARDLLERKYGAGFLALGMYFSSPLWFYSRSFFTEPYIWSSVVLAIWFVARGHSLSSSLLLGLALAFKESALLAVAPVLLGVGAIKGWRLAARLLPGPIIVFGAWLLKNLVVYGEPLITFQPYRVGEPLRGLIGVLFGPRHGVLVFAPILALVVFGLPRRQSLRDAFSDPVLLAWLVVLPYLAVTAAWITWSGGSCYGPRLMIPAIAASALPVVAAWQRWRDSRAFRWALATLLVIGFTIQLSAALKPFHSYWSPTVFEVLSASQYGPIAGLLLGSWLVKVMMRQLPTGFPSVTEKHNKKVVPATHL